MNFAIRWGIAIAAVASIAGITPASAVPLPPNTTFDVNGSLRATGGTTFDTATGIDFGTGTGPIVYGGPGNGGTVTIGGALGAPYVAAGFATGNVGTATDILNGNLSVGTKNIAAFYQFVVGGNTLTFDLGTITVINRQAAVPAAAVSPGIVVYGTGTIHLTGYDDTTAIFSLSTTNTGGGLSATFQSSVNTGATPTIVPEPASLALLGVGLAGLGMIRRRKGA